MIIESSVEITRPAAQVFDYVADMSNNTRWQNGQVACTWTSQPPLRIGSTYAPRSQLTALVPTCEESFGRCRGDGLTAEGFRRCQRLV